ncbi:MULTISPECIES: MFS transporter [Gordonia]|uniref:MFS transporter n=1 Tax=Gordonia amicalis TaxID=89053 RepID=A0AAE4R2C1_9ACTN|nr:MULTISPECIES: MFS transporter [Gordonia]MCZ4577598.1 MFS transporter [Gordonia amicalis]MCZ4651227.1 MFS transporter [Gordonia amicalis]MDJ0451408.1 MFS transporter [Gordonia amicalis]MDV6305862.1 MFS transporter [Gordonia amicalis]MDV6310422.1 MFS transporter [Gordonia amicalis]
MTAGPAWLALAGCLLGVFMQMLDTTIVNIALPDLTVDLGASTSQQLLVLTVYTLSFACTLLTAATLGGRYGRRRLFLIAMIAFTVTSMLCGLATDPVMLIVFRGAQGISAALISAQTLALIAALFTRERHGLVFGIYGAVAGLAAILGPVVGGLLVHADVAGWGWRTIFFVNLPLGIVACVLAWRRLPAALDPDPDRPDIVGMMLSATALLLLLYPLAVGREQQWPALLWVMLGAAVVLSVAFVWQQKRLAARGGTPLLRMDLFSSRRFAVGLGMSLLFFSVFAGFFFTVSITAQFGLGYSALETGLLALPFACGAAVGSVASPWAVARVSAPRVLLGGVLTVGVAFAWIALVLDPASETLPAAAILAPLVLGGVGTGSFVAPLQAVILSDTSAETVGSASGTIPTVQQIGASIGLALVTMFFFGQVAGQTDTSVPAVHAELVVALEDSPVDPMFRPAVADRFTWCATRQLTSPHPERPATGCAGTPANSTVAAVAAEAQPWTQSAARAVTARTFLGAFRTTLWVLAALAIGVGCLTLVLRRNDNRPASTMGDGAVESSSGETRETIRPGRPRSG